MNSEGIFIFFTEIFRSTPRMSLREFLLSVANVVVESIPPVLIFGIALGVSIAMEFILSMKVVGAEQLSPYFSSLSIVREIGPMTAGTMVLVRSGTRITSEIASMKDRGILLALEVFPIDSFSFVVLPRFWAIVFGSVIFASISIVVCILSARFLIVDFYGVSIGTFWDEVEKSAGVYDISVAFLKCLIIGISNALLSTYYGWTAKEGALGISEAVRKSVSLGVIFGITLNLGLSILFF